MIIYKTIAHKALKAYIESESYLQSEIVPISPIRALAQAHNPEAQAEDIVLILAYQGETLVGYLGILPDNIFSKDGNFLHIGWFSCIWVDNNMRGQGIAKSMLQQAYTAWKGYVILAQFTKEAYQIYSRMDIFKPYPQSPIGLRLYSKCDLARILPSKKPILKKISFLLKGFDYLANLYFRGFSTISKVELSYKVQYLDHFTPDDLPITTHNYLVPTSLSKLNWIVKYPWLRKDKIKTAIEKKYYFTSVDESFERAFIKLTDTKGNLLATFMLLGRGHLLKIPYLYAIHQEAAAKVIHFVLKYMKEKKFSTFVCYQPMLLDILHKAPMGFIHKIEKENPYLVGRDLLNKLPDLNRFILQDGNGDAAFT